MSIALQILSGVSIFGSIILIILRTLQNSGVKFKKGIVKKIERESYNPTIKECFKIFRYSVLFRLFIIFCGFVIYCIFIEKGSNIKINEIANIWERWDSTHYIRISKGYTSYIENGDYPTLVFFPLYPILLRIVNIVIDSPQVSGILVSIVCTSAACVFMYKLVSMDYGKNIAKKAVILINIFPFGFFLGSIMSEGVFLLTSVMTLYYIRKHNWQLAGTLGMLCALSRSVGAFLIFPATIEFIEEYKLFKNFKDIKSKLILIFKKWIWLLLIPFGTCIYLYINYKVSGDPLYFIKMEGKYWNNGAQWFFKMPGDLWNWILSGHNLSTKMCIFIPGLAMLIYIYILMISSVLKHRTMYSIWLCAYLIVNTMLKWPISICRYIVCAVPVFIFLGEKCEKNKKLYTGLTVGFSILFGIYLTGYLQWYQIM